MMPSWKSEFIHGYGCGLFGGVDPYTVLQPVCAAIAMTDMPLAAAGRRPAAGSCGLNASCRITAVIAPMMSLSEIGPCAADACLGVLVVLAAEAHEQVRHRLAEQLVFLRAARLQRRELLLAGLRSSSSAFARKRSAFAWIQRPHVRLGHRRHRPQDALLAAAGARAVARHQRVVVPPHHQHVAQRRGLRILRPRVVVEAEILLRRVGQQVRGTRCRVSCSALTSSVSCTIRSAWCSPHAVTHAAHPLQRSDTKIEKTPPAAGLFFSGVAKIALAFWYAIGTLSMTLKNSLLRLRREAVDLVA